jgi:hypothetical protein
MLSEYLTSWKKSRRESWPPSSVQQCMQRVEKKLREEEIKEKEESRLLLSYANDDDSDQELVSSRQSVPLNDFYISREIDPLSLSEEDIIEFQKHWEEPIEVGILMFNSLSKLLISGEADAIIKLIVINNCEEYPVPKPFVTAFLWSFEYFMSPYTFLQILIIYYRVPFTKQEEKMKNQYRIITILTEWITIHYDSLHKKRNFLKLLNQFIQYLEYGYDSDVVNYIRIKKTLQQCHAAKLRLIECVHYSQFAQLDKDSNLELLAVSPRALAEQLTILEESLVRKLSVRSYRNITKKKVQNEELMAIITRFNENSFWVVTTIVKNKSPRERSYVITYWVEVMEHLLQLRNFQSLLPVYLGLTLHTISNLKQTWKYVSKSTHESIQEIGQLLSQTHNYTNYRKCIPALDKVPFIPLQVVISKDLTTMEENRNFLPNGHVNWSKMSTLSKVLEDIRRSRECFYSLETDEIVTQFIFRERLTILSEQEIYSLKLNEPEKKLGRTKSGSKKKVMRSTKSISPRNHDSNSSIHRENSIPFNRSATARETQSGSSSPEMVTPRKGVTIGSTEKDLPSLLSSSPRKGLDTSSSCNGQIGTSSRKTSPHTTGERIRKNSPPSQSVSPRNLSASVISPLNLNLNPSRRNSPTAATVSSSAGTGNGERKKLSPHKTGINTLPSSTSSGEVPLLRREFSRMITRHFSRGNVRNQVNKNTQTEKILPLLSTTGSQRTRTRLEESSPIEIGPSRKNNLEYLVSPRFEASSFEYSECVYDGPPESPIRSHNVRRRSSAPSLPFAEPLSSHRAIKKSTVV